MSRLNAPKRVSAPRWETARLTYAHVGELSVWYERRGEGPPVLFISGSGGDLRTKPNVFDGLFSAAGEASPPAASMADAH